MRTKIQYNNYEPGEYSDETERSFDQTVQLIESFPWDQQREHFSVGLTNPSITIDDLDGNFLKLAPWYNGKFILYFFNTDKHLYTRSFDDFHDAIPIIKTFFESSPFDTSGFHHQSTLLTNPGSHFRTNDFRYSPTFGRLLSTTWASLLVLTYVLAPTIAALFAPGNFQWILLIFLPVWVLIICFFILFLNHFRASNGKVLILSKGKDDFYYGPADDPAPLRKQDITSITTYGRPGKGHIYGWTARVEIVFKDGRCIDISCLIIQQLELMKKFPGLTTTEVMQTFPFMPRDVSALSE